MSVCSAASMQMMCYRSTTAMERNALRMQLAEPRLMRSRLADVALTSAIEERGAVVDPQESFPFPRSSRPNVWKRSLNELCRPANLWTEVGREERRVGRAE